MISEPWTKRYAPTKVSEVIGQFKAVAEFADFIKNFPKERAALFAGPPGCGKTALIQSFANEYGFEVVEMNASDKRNKDAIITNILPACKQASIFGSKKIIVLDEIDGVSGMKDRGGVAELLTVVDETKFPVVFIANDPYSDKLKSLRKKVRLIAFAHVNYLSISKLLREICVKEKIVFDEMILKNIAAKSNGDVRAAINDLQMSSSSGKVVLSEGIRNVDENIFEILKMIFKSSDGTVLLNSMENLDEEYSTLMYWLDENVSKEYAGRALAKAYDSISRADIFQRRIMNWQHWRFLVYIQYLLSVGVQQARVSPGASWVSYRPPMMMLKIWQRNMRRAKVEKEMNLAAEKLHASAYRLEHDFLPYFRFIEENNKGLFKEIKEELSAPEMG